MSWWRREEEDNPAWPGLVDIFAFTLVLFMLLWFGTDWQKKIQELKNKITELEKQNIEYQIEIKELEKKLRQCEDIITGGGIKELKKLFDELKAKIPAELMQDSRKLRILPDPRIVFGSGEYKLKRDDEKWLSGVAPFFYEHIKKKPFVVLINGQADPQPLPDRGLPPTKQYRTLSIKGRYRSSLTGKISSRDWKTAQSSGTGCQR